MAGIEEKKMPPSKAQPSDIPHLLKPKSSLPNLKDP
jgi:hypothetical protein